MWLTVPLGVVLLVLGVIAATPLAAQDTSGSGAGPLSAIDWLRRGSDTTGPTVGAYPVTPPTEQSGAAISIRRLDALRPEAVGLFPAARVGLPSAIWGNTPSEQLVPLIRALPDDTLPALRDLALRILLAEFDAPLAPRAGLNGTGLNGAGIGDKPEFLLARLDVLQRIGALDQAAALLDTLGSSDPTLRVRRFELALLLGDEARACADLLAIENTVTAPGPLIYCHVRASQWDRAESLLADAVATGRLSGALADLLTQFVHEHEETLPGAATLLPPGATEGVTPLSWRLVESLGEPLGTQALPVGFAHADLRGTAGWRAQIEAAERLVRARALPPNRLLGLYTERRAAASGGIWERVRTIAALDAALTASDAGGGADGGASRDGSAALARALEQAWPLVQGAELEVAVADLFAPSLLGRPLDGEAAQIAFTMGLLSRDYETIALGVDTATATPETLFLTAVARGMDPAQMRGVMNGEMAASIALVFGPAPPVPAESRARIEQGALGAELLETLGRLGGAGDPRALAEGLSVLRLMGFEDVVRRAALEVLLLERRG